MESRDKVDNVDKVDKLYFSLLSNMQDCSDMQRDGRI